MISRTFHVFPVVQMWQKPNAAVFSYCKSRFMPQMRCRGRARQGKPPFLFFVMNKLGEAENNFDPIFKTFCCSPFILIFNQGL